MGARRSRAQSGLGGGMGVVGAALVVLVGTSVACTSLPEHVGPERLYWRAPLLLPDVNADLRRPGFWISRLVAPDEVVMNADQIAVLNQNLVSRGLVRAIPLPVDPTPAPARLAKDFDALAQRTLFLPDGRKVDDTWWKAMRSRLNLEASFPERFAIAVAWVDQRILPDNTRLTAEVLDSEFDEFQNSGYDLGTVFQVSHETSDGQWVWARGTQSDGWLGRSRVAFCDRQTLVDWQSRASVVVTAARAELWSDPGRRAWRSWLRMGARLPLEADEGDLWRVSVPVADPEGRLTQASAWIPKSDAVAGNLVYTRRAVLDQAFKLLDRPYGWGDSFGEQDCSRFVASVFSTFGIFLPRNSAAQGVSGVSLASFARTDPVEAKSFAVATSDPATTTLRLDGHIMLFLGTFEGRPYVIHSLWAYTQVEGKREVVRVINATAVSTLSLSEGSKRGSLLERIRSVRTLQPLPDPTAR